MAETAQPGPMDAHAHEGGTRRDFLSIAATAVAGVGAACAMWPLISSMNPAQDTLAAGAPVDIDISGIQPGQQIIVLWRSRPIFIVHRTPEQIDTLKADKDAGQLRDPNSAALQQPGYAKNVYRSIKPDLLVLVGICTHLGCIPEFTPQPGGALGASWPGGYFCPCHGSRYDLSGRVFQNVPAPNNLPVPPYHFVNDKVIRIGENPPDSTFDFNSIEQI
jgi:ubiquinol-cytochrome c reductase iron-sulfur subunit